MIKPITSRVQSATQKGERIIEPLLNVGAAGVKGGSATRKSPSPLKAEFDRTLGAGEVDKKNQDDSNSETTTETKGTAAADSKDTLITNADVTGNSGGNEDQEDVISIVDNIEPKRTSSREENTERLGVERQDRRTDRNIARRELRRIGREAARDARQSDGGTRADGFKARRDITLGRSFGNDYQEKLYNTARGITGNEEANSEMRDRARETATTSGIAAAENSALDGVIPGKKKFEQSSRGSRELNNIPEDNSEAENFEFTKLPQGKTSIKSKPIVVPKPQGAKLKPIGERPAQKSNLDRALDQKNQDAKDDQLDEYNKNPFNPNTTGQIGGRDQAPQSDYRPRPIELTEPKDSEMSDGTPRAENSRSFVSKDRMIKPEDSRMGDGTPTRENNKSVISMAQMRMNSNVGIKSKSPMKKGYFNGK